MRFRVVAPLALLLATVPVVLCAAAPAEKKPKQMIGSTVFKWDDLKPRPTPNGERRDVADNPTPTLSVFECHITTLNPGRASHEPHRHPQEELSW